MHWLIERKKVQRQVMLDEVVQTHKKPKTEAVLESRELERSKRRCQQDVIPIGSLCYLNPAAVMLLALDFKYCTLLKTVVSKRGRSVTAEILTPDGKFMTMNAKWLRYHNPQNGNL